MKMITAKLSRRDLLRRAGIVAGVAATDATAFAYARNTRNSPTARVPGVSLFGIHQAGITTPPQRHLLFISFDIRQGSRQSLKNLMIAWTRASVRLTGSGEGSSQDVPLQPPAHTTEALGLAPARLTLTYGVGPTLFEKTGLVKDRPDALVDLPRFNGDNLDPASTGGDLCVQACADSPQVVFHAVHELARVASGYAIPRWSQSGFLDIPLDSPLPRNLMGFQDGTNNLDPADDTAMSRHVWVNGGDGPLWMSGGTYLVARRIDINLEAWDETFLGEQERIIGRRRGNGAPLSSQVPHDPIKISTLPASSHIRVANPRSASSESERLLRRGYNFSDNLDRSLGYVRQDCSSWHINEIRANNSFRFSVACRCGTASTSSSCTGAVRSSQFFQACEAAAISERPCSSDAGKIRGNA
jgi:deferrochelatase/peroxidase EfeB